MSELGGVIILTEFQGLSTDGRNPVDNPSPLGAELGINSRIRSLKLCLAFAY
jgi:hypothetical protein